MEPCPYSPYTQSWRGLTALRFTFTSPEMRTQDSPNMKQSCQCATKCGDGLYCFLQRPFHRVPEQSSHQDMSQGIRALRAIKLPCSGTRQKSHLQFRRLGFESRPLQFETVIQPASHVFVGNRLCIIEFLPHVSTF
jgi:hypothetical protein